MSGPESAAERYTVRSVARALGILEDLATAPQEGRSVTDIAKTSGLSKSATFAVLQTMVAMNFVADSGTRQNRRYRLGMALTRLGEQARDQVSVRTIAHPVLQDLAAELNCSVRLGMLDGDHVSIIDQIDPPQGGLRIDLGMGNQERLHSTAVGKAILAALEEKEAEALLAETTLTRQTPKTLTTVAAVLTDIRAIRTRGYSIDDEEDFEGVLCLGAAIHDGTGAPVAAISVTTLNANTIRKQIDSIGTAMAKGAGRISARLGYPPERAGR